MRLETRARARALQALYTWDMRNNGSLERIASEVWDDIGVTPGIRQIAEPIIRRIASNQADIDAQLVEVTTNWRLERIGAVERCVLRMAAAELMIGVTPPKVIIQESVMLAERFGSSASAKFVNGVLDALARRMGRM